MKKVILFALLFVVTTCSMAFAEASFQQIQGLIKEQNYSAAIQGLEGIIQNHPKSAKAFYAMSQAQAGIGNQVKAKEALDRATGLDPSLKFASSGNVSKLKEAITPQTKKIEAIESNFFRNCFIVVVLISGVCFFVFRRKKEEAKRIERKPDYGSDPIPNPRLDIYHTTPIKFGVAPVIRNYAHNNDSRIQSPPVQRTAPMPVHNTTVINNAGNNNGFVEGMIIGSVLNNHHEHYDTVPVREVVVEREVVREPSKSSSWEEPKEEKSSSWEDKSSSSSSSSWDSGSSDSSSSWDSGPSDSSSSSWD